MKDCTQNEMLMQDALFGDITEEDRGKLEVHLQSCSACANSFRAMQQTLAMVTEHRPRELPETYWDTYYDRLMDRIERETRPVIVPVVAPFWERLIGPFRHQPKWMWQVAIAILLVVAGIAIGRKMTPAPQIAERGPVEQNAPAPIVKEDTVAEKPASDSTELEPAPVPEKQIPAGSTPESRRRVPEESNLVRASLEQRTLDYLGRSKVLLLGLVNFDQATENASILNLPKNREVARKLMQEAVVLKSEYEDQNQQRLKELVGDLEIILMQIANLEAEHDLPAIELVKSSVDQRALLLKINITEMHVAEGISDDKTPKSPVGTERL